MDTRPLVRKRKLRKSSEIGEEIRRELEKRGLRAPKLGKFSSDWLNENTVNPQSLIEKFEAVEEAVAPLAEPRDNDADLTRGTTIVDILVQDHSADDAERVSVAEVENEKDGGSFAIPEHDQAPSNEDAIRAPEMADEIQHRLPETLVNIQEHEEVPAEEELSAPEATGESDPEELVDIQLAQEAPHDGLAAADSNESEDGATAPLVDVRAQDIALDEGSGEDKPEENEVETPVDRHVPGAAENEAGIASEGRAVDPQAEELPETEEFNVAQKKSSDHPPAKEPHAQVRTDEMDNPFTMIINKAAPTSEPEEDLPQTAELDLEILELLDSYQNVQPPTSPKGEKRPGVSESLLSTASHELRTPLQTITGFLELCLSGKVSDTRQVEQFMRIAYREGKYLADRIADLETASQIEAGTLKINPRKVVIAKVIRSSLQAFEAQSWDRAIRFDESNSAEIPEIYADEEQLRHALVNVLGIALKAAPFGGEVFVRAFLKDKELIVQVISGSGNLSQDVEDLKKDESGVSTEGLGVFVAANILRSHGGSLQIRGSSEELLFFELHLPIEPKAKTKGTILITDDNHQAAAMLEIALEKDGYSPIMARNGLEALEIVANDSVDLVILDVVLPGMDGFEVCYRMRSAPETASIPVVIASAKINGKDHNKALRVGADAYFQKPLVLAELLGSIEALLVNAGDRSADEASGTSSGVYLS